MYSILFYREKNVVIFLGIFLRNIHFLPVGVFSNFKPEVVGGTSFLILYKSILWIGFEL